MMMRWAVRETETTGPADPNAYGSPMIPIITVEKILQWRHTLTDKWKDIPVEPEHTNDH
jgi:hypothetical protein